MQIGGLVAMIPAAEFPSLFAAVQLARDTVTVLLRPDGSIVARYPEQPDTSVDKTMQTCGMLLKPFNPSAFLTAIGAAVSLGREA